MNVSSHFSADMETTLRHGAAAVGEEVREVITGKMPVPRLAKSVRVLRSLLGKSSLNVLLTKGA